MTVATMIWEVTVGICQHYQLSFHSAKTGLEIVTH